MKESVRVMAPWVAQILQLGGDTETAVRHAQAMAREAFTISNSLGSQIDRDFGRPFRAQTLETLLRRERELDALRQRVARGGSLRAGDRDSMSTLLQKRMKEYTALAHEILSRDISSERRGRLERYLDARRQELYLGDAERVRSAISEFLTNAAIAC